MNCLLRLSAKRVPVLLARRPSSALGVLPNIAAVASRRAYTPVEVYSEKTAQLDPIGLQKYLQSNKEREMREFLCEESEMIACESFNVDPDVPPAHHHNKAVNEEFAKQIHDLLHPSYGSA